MGCKFILGEGGSGVGVAACLIILPCQGLGLQVALSLTDAITKPRLAAPIYTLYTSLCTGELNAIRKHKCFLCSPYYVKGVSLGHAGRNLNLKDLKDILPTLICNWIDVCLHSYTAQE